MKKSFIVMSLFLCLGVFLSGCGEELVEDEENALLDGILANPETEVEDTGETLEDEETPHSDGPSEPPSFE
jgi:outer membrane lipoprotein-sorting protein